VGAAPKTAAKARARISIAPATVDDVPLLLGLITALATYEHLTHRLTATEERLREALFGEPRLAEAIIARAEDEAVGFAVFFTTFSTFAARPGLYLEDLFVEPEWRARGVGRRLLAHVASVAVRRGCHTVSWSVLDWNEPAIRFYRGLGAEPVAGWSSFHLSGDALRRLVEEEA
jgi:GNAT superfamily N-acetyltransferase